MVKIYVASPLKFDSINQSIKQYLQSRLEVDVFLPISLDSLSTAQMETLYIAELCYQEIQQSNIIIAVIPFGLSVAAELGYAIYQKRLGKKKIVIAYFSGLGYVKKESMIDPYIDYQTDSLEDLTNLVAQLIKKEKL